MTCINRTKQADNQAGLASPGNYDHVLYIVNSAKSCNFGGIGHVPGWWSMVRNDWPSDTVAIALHELGHNLGWGHSGVCTNNQDSQAIFNNSAAESCNLQAYRFYHANNQ